MPRTLIRRADDNQAEMVKTIRSLGTTVAVTHTVGRGFPDIVVGCDGWTLSTMALPAESRQVIYERLKQLAIAFNLTIHRGANLLVEIKDGDKIPSKRSLTKDEQDWHETWKGQVDIWESREDVLKGLGFE